MCTTLFVLNDSFGHGTDHNPPHYTKMSNKKKIVLSVTGVVLSTAFLVTTAILAEEDIIGATASIVFTLISVILLIIMIFYAAKVDYETGAYVCRKCGHTFTPSFKAYILGPHTLTTRYLKCSECGEKSWCKRKTKR